MLDFNYIQEALSTFSLHQASENERRKSQLEAALALLRELHETGEEIDPSQEQDESRKDEKKKDELVAKPIEHVATKENASSRPSIITVLATDGSQIYPDHHIDPPCYLLNVSQIVFRYGTTHPAEMNTHQELRYREQDRLDFPSLTTDTTAEMVSLLRDQLEMDRLLTISEQAFTENIPQMAIGDGTLVRWMLNALNNRPLEEALVERYISVLRRFREMKLPYFSYQSQPNHREVIKLLETRLGDLDTLRDRVLFTQYLKLGERSALFETTSHIMKEYAPEDRICYFYVKVSGATSSSSEVARIEMPCWIADDAHLTDLVHAVVLDQCAKGDGYPVILMEAHERAIIRTHEKEIFYRLLNRQLRENGMGNISYSRKQMSKRRPTV